MIVMSSLLGLQKVTLMLFNLRNVMKLERNVISKCLILLQCYNVILL